MVINTPDFGALVRAARGDRTQDQIDELGGPPRQRQSVIERGDNVDLSAAVLNQLDTAFRWAPGTAGALADRTERPSFADEHLSALDPTALGLNAAGQQVTMPAAVVISSAETLLPVAERWPGPVLIDNRSPGLPTDWPQRANHIDAQRVRRAGCDLPDTADPIAIDPFRYARRYRQAIDLFEALENVGLARDVNVRLAALSLLFLAAAAYRDNVDGLTALSKMAETQTRLGEPKDLLDLHWRQFCRSGGLSTRFMRRQVDLSALFDGLLAVRDYHVDVQLTEGDGDAPLELVNTKSAEIVEVPNLAGTIVVYDAHRCPELPIVVDWAYQNAPQPPLVIAPHFSQAARGWEAPQGWEASSRQPGLPNSRLAIIYPNADAEIDSESPSAAQLVTAGRPAGSAILLPAQASGQQPETVWLQ